MRTLVFLGFFVMQSVNAAYVDDLRRLHNEVIDVNNPWLRPSLNSNLPTKVSIIFFSLSSISLDDITQTMSSSGYLGVTWRDEFLNWPASNYSGISSLYPNPNKIWRPTLAVKNSIEKATPFRADFMYTTVTANGEVLWYPGDVFQTVCEMDVSKFPFDTHVCNIDFTLWRSTPTEVDLLLLSRMKFNMDEFVENNLWQLVDQNAERINNTNSYPFVRLTFTLRRQPRTYITNVVAPIFAIALLNVFIFLIPSQSGEKIQFGILVLLAYAIFMSFSAETLPQSWNTTSTLGNYFLVLEVFCLIYILLSILSATIYAREDFHHGISPTLARVVENMEKIFLCRCCKKRPSSSSTIEVSPMDEPCSHNGTEMEFGTKRPLPVRRIPERIEMNWKRVSRAFDMLFFWLFLLIVICSMIGVMTYITPMINFDKVESVFKN
ncbi:neuronal acetylcholine receptor subunit beta-3-like [Haliotis rufescens]|uniref:neuronal acetylcholine receptor subunit beta-3-like n=1 Tax=Haliotis rufescens TaxID=6454 RepID=UPI00201F09CB|nr:neuronal acetylcholine receptor subunit beta-3-like [Haliotis rufescens]